MYDCLTRIELEFIKMGLRGLSVLFASGDWGVSGLASTAIGCSRTWPNWPASSPYVTSVGGTQFCETVRNDKKM